MLIQFSSSVEHTANRNQRSRESLGLDGQVWEAEDPHTQDDT